MKFYDGGMNMENYFNFYSFMTVELGCEVGCKEIGQIRAAAEEFTPIKWQSFGGIRRLSLKSKKY